MARDTSIRVRVSEEEEVQLLEIGQRMADERSGIRNHDGTINVSAVIRRLIKQEANRA